MLDHAPLRLRLSGRRRLAFLVTLWLGASLNIVAVACFHQTQSMLIGASSERYAEDEQHPGLYRSETAYLRDLRRRANRDDSISKALMLASVSLTLSSMFIVMASLNVKVRVPDPEPTTQSDS